jgi:hypothetical protein
MTDYATIKVYNRFSTRMRVKFFLSDMWWLVKYSILDINWFVVLGLLLCIASAVLVLFGLGCLIRELFT